MDNRFLPVVVGAVMLALGLTLTVADFRRAATVRRPLLVALICQSLILPVLCLLIAEALHLAPNLTLTAINAVLSIFAIPAILAFSLSWFLGEGRFIPLQFDKFFTVFAMVLIPVAIGVAIRHRFPDFARRLQKVVRIAAAVLLVLAVVGGIAGSQSTLWRNFGVLSAAVVSFCAISLTVGHLVSRWMKLAPRQAIAVSLEIGLHTAVVAVGIALSPQLLNNTDMAMPAAVYGIIGPLIALAFIVAVRRLDPAYRELAGSPAAEAT